MQTLSINFQIPSNWAELGDKQLRYVFSLLAQDFSTDELKTLCLLQWSDTKVIGRQPSGAYLLKKGKLAKPSLGCTQPSSEQAQTRPSLARGFLFEVTPVMLAEILPHLDWLANIPTTPVRQSKINRRPALAADFQGVPFETYIVVGWVY